MEIDNKIQNTPSETKEQLPSEIKVEEKKDIPQENQEQINWKKFREAREVERKQKEAAEKRASEKEAEALALKAAMEAILNKPAVQQSNNYNQEEESEDERINKKVEAAIALRDKKSEEERARREQQEFPERLNSNYKDFNQVCNSENLDYLEYHYPEIAAAYKNLPDGYDKWSNLYKAVKKLVPNTDSRKDQNKAEKNFNKPQAMSIPGKTQVGDTAPQQLDDKRRSDNWARMQKVMKGGS